MRNSWWVGFLALSLVAACGAGNDDDDDDVTLDAPEADADVTQPDADLTQPDADLTQPDAEHVQPDAPPADAGSAPIFTVTFADTCAAFTPCGGAVVGLWYYTGVCITPAEVLEPVAGVCDTATFLGGTGSGTGQALFTASTVTRDVEATYSVTVNLPATCTFGMDCATIASYLPSMGYTGTCVAAASGCDCTIDQTLSQHGATDYTASGTTLTTSSPAHTYEYCVSGASMLVDDTTSTSPELGLATLELQ